MCVTDSLIIGQSRQQNHRQEGCLLKEHFWKKIFFYYLPILPLFWKRKLFLENDTTKMICRKVAKMQIRSAKSTPFLFPLETTTFAILIIYAQLVRLL